ncbi:hypothetical protein [Sphingomonas montana]|uniref:hypothetical protein n=1 Tax=Sphingomonas montana TaxID=1843236 RepID=UPI00096F4512|nr:hypothetical protein [Sphingomonas montana]
MAEATWGDAKTPAIDWRMSASLANVPRGDSDVAEVTNLERAVRDWCTLDAGHRAAAVLTTEYPVQVDGTSGTTFTGQDIAVLVDHLPTDALTKG